MEPLSLYLHIPFCRHRCAYCDFNTYTTLDELREEYVNALTLELEQVVDLAEGVGQRRPLQTIYLGGGTPSLLTIAQLHRILKRAVESFALMPDAEITLEANPDTVEEEYLARLREIGFNRLSFGVQSAVASELALLERTHDFSKVIEVMAWARAAGFDNISLDLIYGVPGQDLPSWKTSLSAALKLIPEHLSLYCLTIEPGTPMQRWLSTGRIVEPDADMAAEQYEYACEVLASAGYEHYEISNWALPGHACQHNLSYWRNQEYLGLGAGAHGQANGYRYQLVKQPRVYIRRIKLEAAAHYPLSSAVAESHPVSAREAMSDTVITQLRLLQEGLDMDAFRLRFGGTLDDEFNGLVTQLVDWGLLSREGNRLLLSERGRFISNQVFYRFM